MRGVVKAKPSALFSNNFGNFANRHMYSTREREKRTQIIQYPTRKI